PGEPASGICDLGARLRSCDRGGPSLQRVRRGWTLLPRDSAAMGPLARPPPDAELRPAASRFAAAPGIDGLGRDRMAAGLRRRCGGESVEPADRSLPGPFRARVLTSLPACLLLCHGSSWNALPLDRGGADDRSRRMERP